MILGISSKQGFVPLDYRKSFLIHVEQVSTSETSAISHGCAGPSHTVCRTGKWDRNTAAWAPRLAARPCRMAGNLLMVRDQQIP